MCKQFLEILIKPLCAFNRRTTSKQEASTICAASSSLFLLSHFNTSSHFLRTLIINDGRAHLSGEPFFVSSGLHGEDIVVLVFIRISIVVVMGAVVNEGVAVATADVIGLAHWFLN